MKRKQQQWNKNYDSGCSSNRKRKQSHRLINISLSISLGVHPCRTSTHTLAHSLACSFARIITTPCNLCGKLWLHAFFVHCPHLYVHVYTCSAGIHVFEFFSTLMHASILSSVWCTIMHYVWTHIYIYKDICVHVCMRLMHVLFTKRDHMPNCISKSQKWIALSWAELSCNI